jgi:hypothetical protein
VTLDEAPAGYHREWVADEGWKIGGDGRTCRRTGCGKLAVAALKRSHRYGILGFQWWYYCESHLYGRKIEDGVVKVERLAENVAGKGATP